MIVVSPHLDDAVFSCGALLAEREATVVTICAGIPPAHVPPHRFDREARFGSAAEAMEARRAEDQRAADVLGFEVVHCDVLEVMYDAQDGHPERIGCAVVDVLEQLRASDRALLLGPLGLRHIDHEAVASAFREYAHWRDVDAWAYEDLPYAVAWPDYTGPALEAAGCEAWAETINAGTDAKSRAVACYASQLEGSDVDALFGTERYHRLNGDGKL